MILKRINDVYLLVAEGYRESWIEVDGKEYKNFTEGWIAEKPKEIYVLKDETVVVAFGDLTPDEYHACCAKLKGDGYNEEGDSWSDLDREFTYRRFVLNHPAKYEHRRISTRVDPVEIDITGRTDNPYIIPFRFLGNEVTPEVRQPYLYRPNPFEMAKTIAAEFGLELVEDSNVTGWTWSVPEHSRATLEYLKVSGKYSAYKRHLHGFSMMTGAWEECENRYRQHMQNIRDLFAEEVVKMEVVLKSPAKVISALREIQGQLAPLREKVKAYSVVMRIENQIDEIIKGISGDYIKGGEGR